MATAKPKERKPAVDAEVEAATVAPVTTSTVKHAVEAKNTVQEVELNEENGNPGDPIHDPEGSKKLDALFEEAPPLIDVEIVNDVAIDASDVDDPPADELSEGEKKMLEDCEKTITKGLSTFIEVGIALGLILINKLFFPQFKKWEEYLDARWGFTRQRAHQYMQAAEGYQKLKTQIVGERRLPDSERAMRELLKAPKEKVVEILDQLGDDGELTSERIIKVREEVLVFTSLHSQGEVLYEVGKDNVALPRLSADGVWYLVNPVDGLSHPNPGQGNKISRRSKESVTAWRYLVLESDVADPAQWLACLVRLPIQITAIYTSGGKSIHALVRVDAESKQHWDMMKDHIKRVMVPLGADQAAMTGVRLSRLPGAMRGLRQQELLYLNPTPTTKTIIQL